MLQLSPDLAPPSSLGGLFARRAEVGPPLVLDEPPTLALVPYVGEGTLPSVEVSATRDPVEGVVIRDPVGTAEVTSPPPTVAAPVSSVVTPILAPVVAEVLC